VRVMERMESQMQDHMDAEFAEDEAALLQEEWSHWRTKLHGCCGPLVMRYEPGCTFVYCGECGKKVAVPDWDPEGVVEAWNRENEKP